MPISRSLPLCDFKISLLQGCAVKVKLCFNLFAVNIPGHALHEEGWQNKWFRVTARQPESKCLLARLVYAGFVLQPVEHKISYVFDSWGPFRQCFSDALANIGEQYLCLCEHFCWRTVLPQPASHPAMQPVATCLLYVLVSDSEGQYKPILSLVVSIQAGTHSHPFNWFINCLSAVYHWVISQTKRKFLLAPPNSEKTPSFIFVNLFFARRVGINRQRKGMNNWPAVDQRFISRKGALCVCGCCYQLDQPYFVCVTFRCFTDRQKEENGTSGFPEK